MTRFRPLDIEIGTRVRCDPVLVVHLEVLVRLAEVMTMPMVSLGARLVVGHASTSPDALLVFDA